MEKIIDEEISKGSIMSTSAVLENITKEATVWRHKIHRHPELAYEELRTSDLIAEVLTDAGIEVFRGIGGTGVIGVLRKGEGKKSIGLRADMDALPLSEESELPYKSVIDKKMHACGHDGHTAMLLGAAKLLSASEDFDGTVYFVFQPAEEHLDGAYRMIDDGLFDIAPADAFFGMHNWPGLPIGHFAIRKGPMLASFDKFDIVVEGVGGHGALPHEGIDPIVIASQVVTSLQTIVSRAINPIDSAVVSVTHINSGEPSYNVIPGRAAMKGAVRSLNSESRKKIRSKIYQLVKGVVDGFGGTFKIDYEEVCPVLMNNPGDVSHAVAAAIDVVGADRVNDQIDPVMGSEDFAAILESKPGAYIFIGNGDGVGSCMVHNPKYDFNDTAIPYGVRFWNQLVKNYLLGS